jgi:negative regulator of flagellin synthesis FlgM
MAIEILGYPNRPVKDNVESTAAPSGTPGKSAGTAGVGAPGDHVSLTASAALLQELEKEIARLPVVDTGRVEGVQRALATGTFQIDPARTADKLLQLELIMNGGD